MKQKQSGNAHADVQTGFIRRSLRILHYLHDQQEIQNQGNHHTYKSVFLGKRGKDEIGMRYRQKSEVRLRTLFRSAAPHSSIADSYSRLDHLKARSLRIPVRIDETYQSIFLIRLKKMIADRQTDN